MPAPPEGNSQGQKIPPQKPKGKFMNKKAARRHEMGIGSVVKDINPTCPHKGARGEVVKSYPDKVTFIVDNEGPTYSPGDKLTKTIEQMRKTAGSKLKAVKHILRAAGHISRGKALSTGKKYVYNRKIPPNKGYSAQGIPPENSRRALRLHNIEGIERTKVSPG